MILDIYKACDFYIRLFYDLFMHDPINRPWWSDIDENIILGALPHHEKDHLQKLKNKNVKGVITLNTNYELSPSIVGNPVTPEDWKNKSIIHKQIKIEDRTCPSLSSINESLEFINNIISNHKNSKIYVHCKAGKGRSVVIVLCYLMKKNSWNLSQALDFLKTKRKHIHPNQYQLQRCLEYISLY